VPTAVAEAPVRASSARVGISGSSAPDGVYGPGPSPAIETTITCAGGPAPPASIGALRDPPMGA